MSDLIDRQAAIDAVLDRMNVEKHGRDAKPEEIRWTLEVLPSAEPKIVRCKDCKHWAYIKRTSRYWCNTDDGLYDLNPAPYDYCSRAERKENERLNRTAEGD